MACRIRPACWRVTLLCWKSARLLGLTSRTNEGVSRGNLTYGRTSTACKFLRLTILILFRYPATSYRVHSNSLPTGGKTDIHTLLSHLLTYISSFLSFSRSPSGRSNILVLGGGIAFGSLGQYVNLVCQYPRCMLKDLATGGELTSTRTTLW